MRVGAQSLSAECGCLLLVSLPYQGCKGAAGVSYTVSLASGFCCSSPVKLFLETSL